MRRLAMTLAAVSLFSTAALPAAQTENERFFAGIVLEIDPANRVLRIEEASLEGPHMEFTVPRDLEILKDEQTIAFAAVQIGDPVAIEYALSGGEPVVRSVKVITLPRND